MPITGHPPHRSGQARFELIDGEAPIGPGMTDTRRGKPAVGQFRHPIPREAVLLAAPPKRSTPEVGHVMPERRERPTVCGYRIIGEVACNDLPQPVSLIWDSLVHSLPQLHLDFLVLLPNGLTDPEGLMSFDLLTVLTDATGAVTAQRSYADLRFSRPVPVGGAHCPPKRTAS